MSKLLGLIAISLGLSFGAAQAQAQVQVQKTTAQQDKTAMCEKAAANKKGGERQSFISTCMAAKSEPQMTKMSGCDHAGRAEDL